MQRITSYLVMLLAVFAGAMPAHAAPTIQSSYLANWSRVFAVSQGDAAVRANVDALETYLARRAAWGERASARSHKPLSLAAYLERRGRFGHAPSLTSREAVAQPISAALQIYLARRESFGRRPALTSAELNTMTIDEVLSAYLAKRATFGTAPIETHLARYLARRGNLQVSQATDALTNYLAQRTAWGTAPAPQVEVELITAVEPEGFAAQRWTVASID